MGNLCRVSKPIKKRRKRRKKKKKKSFDSEHELYSNRYAEFQSVNNKLCSNENDFWNTIIITESFWCDLNYKAFDFHKIAEKAKDEDTKQKCREVENQMKQHNFDITENLQLLLTHYLDKFVPESKLERFEQFKIQFNSIGAKNLLYYQCVLIEYEWYVHFEPDYSLFNLNARNWIV